MLKYSFLKSLKLNKIRQKNSNIKQKLVRSRKYFNVYSNTELLKEYNKTEFVNNMNGFYFSSVLFKFNQL